MNKNSSYAQSEETEKKSRRDARAREADTQPEGLGEEGEHALARLKEVGKNLDEQIQTQLEERPYVVIGAAAGLGFAAGSILGSRLGQIAVAITAGYLIRNAVKDSGKMQRFVKDGIDKLAGEKA